MDSRPAARATSLHHLLLNERHHQSNLWRMNWTLSVVPKDESFCMVLKPKIDDAYTYGGLHTYGMFRPLMPSFNPVNDVEVFNGFGMQSHPNAKNRSLGCDERVVYEEALQVYNVKVRRVLCCYMARPWVDGRQRVYQLKTLGNSSRYMPRVVMLAVVTTLYTIEVANIAAMVVFSHCPPVG